MTIADDWQPRAWCSAASLLTPLATIVTPETILAWHRKLVRKAMTCGRRSHGRPQKSRDVAALVVKMAKDNPSWGYDRIQGALKNVGHTIAPSDRDVERMQARICEEDWSGLGACSLQARGLDVERHGDHQAHGQRQHRGGRPRRRHRLLHRTRSPAR